MIEQKSQSQFLTTKSPALRLSSENFGNDRPGWLPTLWRLSLEVFPQKQHHDGKFRP